MLDAGSDDPGSFRLERGTSIERYVVLYELGVGGMGVVYAAYDPELDRKVALKLLHADGRSERARNRLLREAKAIARLTHPNVITVHDVGTYEGRVFVAMEYVDGVTLRQWLQQERRDWQQVVQVLLRAGEGLAAAHAADLIHRDFKPDNVLVDRTGRPVVLDFGLARRASTSMSNDEASAHPPVSATRELPPDALEAHLTKTGAKLGTPAYMSPEQHLGTETDARTDQFSFCVVLWEALYGVRPFRAQGSIAMAVKVVRGEIDEPPRHVTVPSWVRRVLTRGLSSSPEQRYPTMKDLLSALRTDPRRRTRRTLTAVGTGLAVLLGGWGAFRLATASPEICSPTQAEQRWAGAWDETLQLRVEKAFGDAGVSYAPTALRGVTAGLDDYADRWRALYVDACEATHRHKEQSEEMLALQMSCLRNRREEVASLAQEFTKGGQAIIENAVEAVAALPRPESCRDVETLAGRLQLADDPATRVRVDALRARLAEARAKEYAGHYTQALQNADAVIASAEDGELPWIAAEALLRRASVLERRGEFEDAQESLLGAVWQASLAEHTEIEAEAWVRLVWVTGVERLDVEQGHVWAKFAEVALQRLGKAERLRANLTHNLGGLYYRQGKMPEALEHYREALREQKRLLGANDPSVAMTLNHIGNALMEQGDYVTAKDYCERSLDLRERILGPRHPKVAASMNNLAELFRKKRERTTSLEYAERSLEIVAGTSGPEEEVALVLAAEASRELQQDEVAARHYDRLLRLRQSIRPEGDPAVTDVLLSLASIRARSGQHAEAVAVWQRAIAHDRNLRPAKAVAALVSMSHSLSALEEIPQAHEALNDARVLMDAHRLSNPELEAALQEARAAVTEADRPRRP